MTDDELLARQAALQDEAKAVLEDLELFRLISAVGRPVPTGSSALGLMVARDIDVERLSRSGAVSANRHEHRCRKAPGGRITPRWWADPAIR